MLRHLTNKTMQEVDISPQHIQTNKQTNKQKSVIQHFIYHFGVWGEHQPMTQTNKQTLFINIFCKISVMSSVSVFVFMFSGKLLTRKGIIQLTWHADMRTVQHLALAPRFDKGLAVVRIILLYFLFCYFCFCLYICVEG
jgi:hypothetical protein